MACKVTIVFVAIGTSLSLAAEWSDWYDLTLCSAKPCGCGRDKSENCNGKKMQIRICNRREGEITTCGKGLPLQSTDCTNKGICPGWSEWSAPGKCDCESKMALIMRECDNPPPVHKDVVCTLSNGVFGSVEKLEVPCICTAEEEAEALQRTTVKTTTTSSRLPWCCEMFASENNQQNNNNYDYPGDYPSRHARDVNYDYYDGVVCHACTLANGYTGKVPKKEGTTQKSVLEW